MHVTVYGKRGNKWTDEVRAALTDKGVSHTLIEEFEWSRDPETMAKAPPRVDKDGKVFIPEMPTIHFKEYAEVWVHGYESCLEYIESIDVAEMH